MEVKRNNPENWVMTEEIRGKIKEKKLAHERWLNTQKEDDKDNCRYVKSSLTKLIRSAKNDAWEKVCADINANLGYQRSKRAWKVLKE